MKDILGNPVSIGDWIAVGQRCGNSGHTAIGRVVADGVVCYVRHDWNAEPWRASRRTQPFPTDRAVLIRDVPADVAKVIHV